MVYERVVQNLKWFKMLIITINQFKKIHAPIFFKTDMKRPKNTVLIDMNNA